MSIAPPHALLVAHWGTEGSAVLSLPTKEYFQSSGWVEEKPPPLPPSFDTNSVNSRHRGQGDEDETLRSVRSASDFWAGNRSGTPSTSHFTAGYFTDSGHGHTSSGHMGSFSQQTSSRTPTHNPNLSGQYTTTDYSHDQHDDNDNESQVTEVPGQDTDEGLVDEAGAQDAFIAGMIYALSRRICPGLPYTPAWNGEDLTNLNAEIERGRWRLDECLR